MSAVSVVGFLSAIVARFFVPRRDIFVRLELVRCKSVQLFPMCSWPVNAHSRNFTLSARCKQF
jgi:hypothetical protein